MQPLNAALREGEKVDVGPLEYVSGPNAYVDPFEPVEQIHLQRRWINSGANAVESKTVDTGFRSESLNLRTSDFTSLLAIPKLMLAASGSRYSSNEQS